MKKLIPSFLLDWYHYILAAFGALLRGFPSRKITVIGITGTSGKSTVVDLTARILEEAGFKTASLSSVRFKMGDKEKENRLKMTMPGRFAIQNFLREAVRKNCEYAVLEVTSEGIKQHRHRFIDFKTAVFTNLSPEHIEAHGGFENYKQAKLKLFRAAKQVHIINIDDENADEFLGMGAEEQYLYKIKNQKSAPTLPRRQEGGRQAKLLEAENMAIKPSGVSFEIQRVEFNLKLLGEFNAYNALAAVCVGLSEGIPLLISKTALEKARGVPGRMEVVIREPFLVVVDYAHTPEALKQVYDTLEKSKIKHQTAKTICVLGSCGGGRDKWKRPVLGKLAARYCQKIIITNEDPYDEDPMEIIYKVAEGAGPKAEKILDRREAIRTALKEARGGDVVVITGKGSEPLMCLGRGKKIAWDDRQIVREEFQKVKNPQR